MGTSADFLQLLAHDVSTNIIVLLDDPADVVRVSSVSRSWRQFVIENGFCKLLCLKLFPELSNATHAIEADSGIQTTSSNLPNDSGNLSKIHKVYTFLALGLSPTVTNDCISKAINASSTDRFPAETIENTLQPMEIGQRLSYCYWSSKGESDDKVPETLRYKLISNLCFITEINIQPFKAYFQIGFPVYSAKAVRFRLNYRKPMLRTILGHNSDGDFYRTYVSPVFPMTQENCLQKFKLPEPVLCVDGILEIELLGRVQRQRSDNLYYICVAHVQVVGRTLVPGFGGKLDCPGNWGEALSFE